MSSEQKEDPKVNRRVTVPPGALMLLLLRQAVLFPSTVMPLVVGRPASLQVVEEAVRQQSRIGFVAQRDGSIEAPRPEDLFRVGTAADILRMYSPPDGQRQIIIQGRQRFEIAEFIDTDPYLIARVTLVEENTPQSNEFQARIIHLRQKAAKTSKSKSSEKKLPMPKCRRPWKRKCFGSSAASSACRRWPRKDR